MEGQRDIIHGGVLMKAVVQNVGKEGAVLEVSYSGVMRLCIYELTGLLPESCEKLLLYVLYFLNSPKCLTQ